MRSSPRSSPSTDRAGAAGASPRSRPAFFVRFPDVLSVAPPHGLWRRFTAAYAQLLTATLAMSVAILVIPVTLQVISRYTDLIPAYIWTEEMARFLFIWMIMIGAMIGVREARPLRGRRLADAAAARRSGAPRPCPAGRPGDVAGVRMGGIEFTRFAWDRTSELADLPLWLIHVAWPVAGLTWIVFLGEQFVDEAQGADRKRRAMTGSLFAGRRRRSCSASSSCCWCCACRWPSRSAWPACRCSSSSRGWSPMMLFRKPSTPTTPSSCWPCRSSC